MRSSIRSVMTSCLVTANGYYRREEAQTLLHQHLEKLPVLDAKALSV
jgi:hypothetical protein